MLRLFAELLFRRLVVLAVTAAAIFEGYLLLRPNGDELGFLRRTLADRACVEIVDDLPRQTGVHSLAVLPLAGDRDGFVTTTLRDTVRASGKYDLMDDSAFHKILIELGRHDVPVADFDGAMAAARTAGVDFVVFGEIVEFETTENRAALKINLRMADRAARQSVFARTYDRTNGGSPLTSDYWRAHMADSSKGRRLVVWVLVVLLLPILTAPIIRRVTAEESNAWNLALLVAYTSVGVGLAFALTGFWIPDILTTLVLVAALAASASYNYLAATLIESLQK